MEANKRPRFSYVISADGGALALSDLPESNNRRWVPRHKANVVAAVRGGLIGLDELCERYKLTIEEFVTWSSAVDKFGIPALRATRFRQYRS